MSAALFLPMALVLAFASVTMLVQTGAALVFDRRDRQARMNRRLALHDAGLSREQVYARLSRNMLRRTQGTVTGVVQTRLTRMMQLAGLTMPLSRFLLLLAGVTGGLWAFGVMLSARGHGGAFLSDAVLSLAGAGMLTFIGAWLVLGRMRRARLKKIEQQMPIALDVMSRALRAGHPVISAIQLAAEEMGDPLGSEFGLALDETTYGAELQEALTNFAERSGSSDAYYLAVSIAVQTETGGNLAEILENLSAVIRGRTSLSQKVKALSSEGRASAAMLTALPALVVGFNMLTHPHMYTDKFSDPIFWPATIITLALYFAGWLIVRRIVNFKY